MIALIDQYIKAFLPVSDHQSSQKRLRWLGRTERMVSTGTSLLWPGCSTGVCYKVCSLFVERVCFLEMLITWNYITKSLRLNNERKNRANYVQRERALASMNMLKCDAFCLMLLSLFSHSVSYTQKLFNLKNRIFNTRIYDRYSTKIQK